MVMWWVCFAQQDDWKFYVDSWSICQWSRDTDAISPAFWWKHLSFARWEWFFQTQVAVAIVWGGHEKSVNIVDKAFSNKEEPAWNISAWSCRKGFAFASFWWVEAAQERRLCARQSSTVVAIPSWIFWRRRLHQSPSQQSFHCTGALASETCYFNANTLIFVSPTAPNLEAAYQGMLFHK